MPETETHTQPSIDPVTKKNPSKRPLSFFVVGVLVVLLLVLVGGYAFVKNQVYSGTTSETMLSFAALLHVPVAKINGNNVPFSEYIFDKTSLDLFYSQQPEGFPASTDQDISDQVLSRLLINELLDELADTYAVSLTDEDVLTAQIEMLSQFPDRAAAEQEISTMFGWDIDTFTERVITPIVLEQKVSDAFRVADNVDGPFQSKQAKARHILFQPDEDGNSDLAKANAEEILQRIKDGEDFATLAAEFGTDSTAQEGGDLGWIDRGVTVPIFEEVIFSLEAGQLYDQVLETEFGFHIVQVDEIRTVNDFALFFQQHLAEADVEVFGGIHNPLDVVAEVSADEEHAIEAPEVGEES